MNAAATGSVTQLIQLARWRCWTRNAATMTGTL
jgi:hypothetical protein